jgi:hypothetical protein
MRLCPTRARGQNVRSNLLIVSPHQWHRATVAQFGNVTATGGNIGSASAACKLRRSLSGRLGSMAWSTWALPQVHVPNRMGENLARDILAPLRSRPKSYTERWSPLSFRNVTLARCLPRVAGVSSSRKLQEGNVMDGFVEALGRGPDGRLHRVAQRCFAKRSERTPAKWRPPRNF